MEVATFSPDPFSWREIFPFKRLSFTAYVLKLKPSVVVVIH